ncbi:MAG TPA: SDR family NAD(P)-dependent oxidoreductase [Candidatus Baltobacteraceae bacterium]|nr:SDR family NAD(P)-dependent oxidoreductase [Candidatus Baltobacteraceae bacterium]
MITGKHAVVTGGGRGIGLAIARALKEKGAHVSIVSRSAPDTGDDFFRAKADVSDEASVSRALDACRAANGPVAILVNDAGIAQGAPLKRTDKAMWDRIIGTNLTGTYLCTRMVIEEMFAAKWGRIVNVASLAGLYGAPYITAYTASKHGIMGFTRALVPELEGSGVTANAICPGYVDTDMMESAVANIVARTGMDASQAREQLAQMNPGGRLATLEEIANAAVSLIESGENGREVVLPDPRESTLDHV